MSGAYNSPDNRKDKYEMTEQLNMLVDKTDALNIYEAAIIDAKKTMRMTRGEAKIYAKQMVYDKYPALRNSDIVGTSGKPNPEFWARVGAIVERYYEEDNDVPATTPLDTFRDLLRECAKTGFILDRQYIKPLVGEKNANRVVPSQLDFLTEEGYKLERNGYGYKCVPVETPEQKAARKRQEQADHLEAEVNRLMDEVRKLRAG